MNHIAITTPLLQGKMRLTKAFNADGSRRNYPMAKTFTSHTKNYLPTKEGLQERLHDLLEAASSGWCMLKGELLEEIKEEPRAGKTARNKKNRSFILDIDGLPIDLNDVIGWKEAIEKDKAETPSTGGLKFIDEDKRKLGRHQIIALAEHIITLLPVDLRDYTYFIHASSSMGVYGKNIISLHIEFILDMPMEPSAQKDTLTAWNFGNDTMRSNIQLAANGMSLRYPLDRTVADNSKLLFIGHPTFEDPAHNPIANHNRIILVEKPQILVPTTLVRPKLPPEAIHAMCIDHVKTLRKALGLNIKKTAQHKNVIRGGLSMEFLNNPDRMQFDIVDDEGDFVHANVNNGDSAGYYWPKNDPTFVYNFKGEPIFRLQDANPEFYEMVLLEYAEAIRSKKGVRYLIRRNLRADGKLHCIELDTGAGVIIQNMTPSDIKTAADWAAHYGEIMPESIPFAYIRFDPTTDFVYDIVADEANPSGRQKEMINTYRECDAYKCAPVIDEVIQYENLYDAMRAKCPATTLLMTHAFGGRPEEVTHFVNWLAFAKQRKRKSGTTWLIHGTQGTGKGLMWEHVIVPLYGEELSKTITINDLDDKFTAHMASKMMILVDEFRHSDSTTSKKLENQLKMMATAERYSFRGMQTESKEYDCYFAMIFFSNSYDAARVENGDRRLNIATRQEIPLKLHLGNGDPHRGMAEILRLISSVTAEAKTFASIIKSMQVDEIMARTPLDNEAKRKMTLSSRTKTEDFVNAVLHGDVGYFALLCQGILQDPNISGDPATLITHLCNAYDQGMATTFVPATALVPFYEAVNGRGADSLSNLLKIMARHAGTSSETIVNNGRQMTRGYEIKLTLTASQVAEARSMMQRNVGNVSAIPPKNGVPQPPEKQKPAAHTGQGLF